MRNELYRRSLTLQEQPAEAPRALLVITVTGEVNGYIVWSQNYFDDDSDGPVVKWWHANRDDAIEAAVNYIRDLRDGKWQ